MSNDFDLNLHPTRKSSLAESAAPAGPEGPCLVVVYSSSLSLRREWFALVRDPTRVGRGADNEIVLPDDSVSRAHAHFEQRGDTWYVVDLGSSNGTLREGKRVQREAALKSGDCIQIGHTLFKLFVGADVEQQLQDEARRSQNVDGLTQVYNKKYFCEILGRALARRGQDAPPTAVLVFDIDNLRRMNEVHGALAADHVLQETARIARARLGSEETVGRIDGDQFAILVSDSSARDPAELAEQLREAILEHEFRFRDELLSMTISVGVEHISVDDSSPHEVLARADGKRYVARRLGGNRVVSTYSIAAGNEPMFSRDLTYRRVLDGPALVAKIAMKYAKKDLPSLLAVMLDDEAAIVGQLGTAVYEEWFRRLLRIVEVSIREKDLIASLSDRYIVAACWADEEIFSISTKVRDLWTAGQASASHAGVSRRIRTATVEAAELPGYGERALDVLVARLLRQPTPDEGLPFPLAALEAAALTRRTALGRVKSLLDAIDAALRFVVAVELGAIRDLGRVMQIEYAGRLLADEAPRGSLRGSLALTLSNCLPLDVDSAIRESVRALGEAQIHGKSLYMWLSKAAALGESLARHVGVSEDAFGAHEEWLLDVLRSILRALRPLSELRLVSVAEIEGVGDDGALHYALYLCRGPSEHFPIVRETLSFPLQKGWCYLLSADKRREPLSLAPIVLSQPCSVCGRVEVAIAETLVLGPTGAKVRVRGVTSSHVGLAEVSSTKRMEAFHRAVYRVTRQAIADHGVDAVTLGSSPPEPPTRADEPPRTSGAQEEQAFGGLKTVGPPPGARPQEEEHEAPVGSSEPSSEVGAPARRVRVFFSYAQADERQLDRLIVHLKLLERVGLIAPCDSRCVSAGAERANDICGSDDQLESAEIILLLISADFLASDYCWDIELERAFKRHEAGQVQVVPILVRPCDWSSTPFDDLQVLPRSGVPVSQWQDGEEVWAEIAKELREIIQGRARLDLTVATARPD